MEKKGCLLEIICEELGEEYSHFIKFISRICLSRCVLLYIFTSKVVGSGFIREMYIYMQKNSNSDISQKSLQIYTFLNKKKGKEKIVAPLFLFTHLQSFE